MNKYKKDKSPPQFCECDYCGWEGFTEDECSGGCPEHNPTRMLGKIEDARKQGHEAGVIDGKCQDAALIMKQAEERGRASRTFSKEDENIVNEVFLKFIRATGMGNNLTDFTMQRILNDHSLARSLLSSLNLKNEEEVRNQYRAIPQDVVNGIIANWLESEEAREFGDELSKVNNDEGIHPFYDALKKKAIELRAARDSGNAVPASDEKPRNGEVSALTAPEKPFVKCGKYNIHGGGAFQVGCELQAGHKGHHKQSWLYSEKSRTYLQETTPEGILEEFKERQCNNTRGGSGDDQFYVDQCYDWFSKQEPMLLALIRELAASESAGDKPLSETSVVKPSESPTRFKGDGSSQAPDQAEKICVCGHRKKEHGLGCYHEEGYMKCACDNFIQDKQFELMYCKKCIQMTNHLGNECQKCKDITRWFDGKV